MICCATSDDIDLIEHAEICFIPFQLVHDNRLAVFCNTLTHCVANGFWLLMNLLEHEVLITAFFRSLSIPINLEDLLRNRIALAI